MKKCKYDDLHEKSAEKVLREIFCPMCAEHEGGCRARYDKDDIKKCFTAMIVKRKIKRILDKYD